MWHWSFCVHVWIPGKKAMTCLSAYATHWIQFKNDVSFSSYTVVSLSLLFHIYFMCHICIVNAFSPEHSFWILRKTKLFPSETNPNIAMRNLGQNITLKLFSVSSNSAGNLLVLGRELKERCPGALVPVSWWCLGGCQNGMHKEVRLGFRLSWSLQPSCFHLY